ncbi:hypothetical protein P3T29_000030 [Kitasatospora sp. MAP5-34]|nr:hypothetical protein [Kitasatospora sp. MAP5-34]
MSSDSMGTEWGMSPTAAPPATLPVGDSGTTSSGLAASYASMARTRASYSSSPSGVVPSS